MERMGASWDKTKTILCLLGTIEPRKNLILAIRGFVRYLDIFPEISRDFKLVIVGKKGWNREDEALTKEIQKHSNYFYFTGYLPKSKNCSSFQRCQSRYHLRQNEHH